MATSAERLLKRHETLKGQQANYRTLCEELATFILPSQMGFLGAITPGSKRTERLFDSTGIKSNNTLAASMAGGLTNEALRWFGLKTTEPDLNEDDEVREHLDAETDAILLGLSQSNFYAEMLETYRQLGGFGMGALFAEEAPIERPGFNGLRFETWPLKSVAIAEDGFGRVNTVFHDLELSAEAALERWPKGLSDATRKKASEAPDTPVPFVHAIYPRPASAPGLPYVSCVIERDARQTVDEGGYHEFPVMVPRWEKATGEVTGRGPGHTALPDLKSLNRAVEMDFKAWAKAIDPPKLVRNRGVFSPVRFVAGGLTYASDLDAVKDLEQKSRWDVTQIKVGDLRASIRETFFADRLQLPAEGPQMTAREVLVRYEIMQRLFGPTLGRLMFELFTPLIIRVRGLLARGGMLPRLPQVLSNRGWTVQYESPLARAARMSEVDAIQRFVGEDLPLLTQLYPGAKDILDPEATARALADRRGVPPSIIVDKRKLAQLRAAQVRQAREEQAKEDASRMAESMGKVAPLLKDVRGAAPAPLAEAA